MSNEAVVLSEANLDILEKNLNSLANNLGSLSTNMSSVDTKVNKVTDTVKTLEEEIKNFMFEIRESTIVSNAKQSILMSQSELDKKYGHYDNIRREVNGLLEATDLNTIKKSTIEALSEKTLLNTPTYWLSPALVALCAWFTNNKDLASRAVNEALKRDDEKTSLLFSLLHLRAKRNSAALLWLKRYIDKQNPKNIENMFIIVLDAVSSGVFGPDAKTYIIGKLEEWIKLLSNNEKIKTTEKNRWKDKFASLTVENKDLVFPYLEKYTTTSVDIKNSFDKNTSRKNIYDFLNNITNKNNDEELVNKKIDKIINLLVFNYENEELALKKEIEKNKLIISLNGNLTKANKMFETSSLAFQEKTDILTLITNILLVDIETLPETKKLALALSKDIIIEAYNEYIGNDNESEIETQIQIDKWTATTIDGKNENELKTSLKNYINKKNIPYINSEKFFNFKMMIAIIIAIVACFLLRSLPQFIILFIGLAVAYCAFEVYNTYKRRNMKISRVDKEIKDAFIILENIICEIVDYNYMVKESKNVNNEIITFLSSLDYKNYSNVNVERNISVGGFNG